MMPLSTLFLSSGDVIADRRFAWAKDLEEKGDCAGAVDLLRQGLDLVPGFAWGWFSLAMLLEKGNDREGAIEALGRAQATDPQDHHGASLHLARLRGQLPDDMPRAYVRTLFDNYAPAFDRALTQGLQYRAPALLRGAVEKICTAQSRIVQFERMLDLGCGTGLAGEAFRSCAGHITGVDISDGMIAQTRRKGIYDRLVARDLTDFLFAEKKERADYDLIVAADVLVYLNGLHAVMSSVAAVLVPDGLFAFTTETHDGEGVILLDTLRYAHAAGYVEKALQSTGLRLLASESVSTRTEKNIAVPGLLLLAQASTAP
jgi:predicted TPR repeat methyltransferase